MTMDEGPKAEPEAGSEPEQAELAKQAVPGAEVDSEPARKPYDEMAPCEHRYKLIGGFVLKCVRVGAHRRHWAEKRYADGEVWVEWGGNAGPAAYVDDHEMPMGDS